MGLEQSESEGEEWGAESEAVKGQMVQALEGIMRIVFTLT